MPTLFHIREGLPEQSHDFGRSGPLGGIERRPPFGILDRRIRVVTQQHLCSFEFAVFCCDMKRSLSAVARLRVDLAPMRENVLDDLRVSPESRIVDGQRSIAAYDIDLGAEAQQHLNDIDI